MAFTNEEVMRATELALRQYHVVTKQGTTGDAYEFMRGLVITSFGGAFAAVLTGEVVLI